MRIRGAGALIDASYRQATSPFVGVHVVYRPNRHYHELINYTYYLGKAEKGAEHFTRNGETLDIPAFLSRLWKAP
jgi:hypothetical protein